jgi:hypothetical protein
MVREERNSVESQSTSSDLILRLSCATSRAHEALPSAPKLIHKSMRPSSAGASGAKPGSGWYTLWRGELKSTPGQYRTPACPYEPSLTSSIPRSNQVESASNANSFLPVLPLLCRTDSPILRPRNPTQPSHSHVWSSSSTAED